MKLKRAVLVGSGLTFSHVLVMLLTASVVIAGFTVYNLYLDALPHSAFYTVESDGAGNYWAIRYDGKTLWDSTNAILTINNALGNLTSGRSWHERVLVLGDITINSPALVYNYTDLEFDYWTLADNSDCNMIENAEPLTSNAYVKIHGGTLDGNEVNQASGHGIYWWNNATTGIPPKPIELYDLRIQNCKQDGIHINNTNGNGEFWIHNVWNHGCARNAFRFHAVCDSYISDLKQVYSDQEPFYLSWCASNTFERFYISASGTGGSGYVGIYGNCIYKNIFTNFRVDNTGTHGIQLLGSWDNVFSSFEITSTDSLLAHNTYDGILLQSTGSYHCENNTVTGGFIGRQNYNDADRWRHGVNEVNSNQARNMYGSINAIDVGTFGFNVSGTDSHVYHSWNGTSWIS